MLEHIWDDERALVEIVPSAAPGWSARGDGADSLAGAGLVGHQRQLSRRGPARTSASTASTSSSQKVERAGCFLRGSHHTRTRSTRPTGGCKCAYGLDNPDAAPVKRYHEFLCHLIEHNPKWARVTERALNPVLGKSLVVYGEKVPPSAAKWGKRSLG